jgi:4-amino-4-deoxy-L-arabinose transferase-like glycosyltransferase
MTDASTDPVLRKAWSDELLSLAIAAAVLAIGAGRLSFGASMWRDEAWSWLAIHRSFAGVVGLVVSDEANMGPYYLGLRAWAVFGQSDAWLRGFSVAGGAAAAVALYRLVLRYFDRPAALLAAVLFITNPVFLKYISETRGYSWSMFLAVASTASLLRALQSDGRRWIVVYGVTTGLALAVNLAVILVIAAQFGGVLWTRSPAKRCQRVFGAGGAIAVVTFLPFLPVTVAQRDVNTSWVPPLRTDETLAALESVVGGHKWALFFLIGGVMLLIGIWWHRRELIGWDFRTGRVMLTIAVLPAPLLVVISRIKPSFVPRYLTPILPFVAGAAAVGFSYAFKKVRWGRAAAATGVAVLFFATGSPFRMESVEQLSSAARFVEDNVEQCDVIVFYPTWSRAGLYRYWQPSRAMDISVKEWPDTDLFPIEYNTDELRALLASESRVWLVPYPLPVSTWHPRAEPLQPLLPELTKRPVLKSAHFGPNVTLFGAQMSAGASMCSRG